MLFFKRILESRTPRPPTDRRGALRYAVGHRFPMKAVLNTIGRDEMGTPLQPRDGTGWDWPGRLLNLSTRGARMQVPSTLHAQAGDACELKFNLEGYELTVGAVIAHISERRDSFVFGLRLKDPAGETAAAFAQLLELVALGAGLKPSKPCQLDDSGYLVEQYAGDPSALLNVWRDHDGGAVTAFDFQLKNCHVRAMASAPGVECLVRDDAAAEVQPAPPAQCDEIRRLFHWVVPNLSAAVPADVREFLEKFAA